MSTKEATSTGGECSGDLELAEEEAVSSDVLVTLARDYCISYSFSVFFCFKCFSLFVLNV